MSKQEFFPEKAEAIPTIYAYKLSNDTSHRSKLKIGFTNRTAQGRIREQIGGTRAEFQIVI
ncbi:hypothetical protein [Gelidibacter japonicus]|uniref:hypothetical protein n=1 Tax=Gelidibacter japonicus TaxID=1962232 RepID=UPI003A8C9BB8